MQNTLFLLHFFVCLATAPADVKQFEIHMKILPELNKYEKFEAVRVSPGIFELTMQGQTGIIELKGTRFIAREKNASKNDTDSDMREYLAIDAKTDFQKATSIKTKKKPNEKQGTYQIRRDPYKTSIEFKGGSAEQNASMYISWRPETRAEGEKKTIDAARCQPGKDSFGFGLGSMRYEIIGKSTHGCVVLYGIEIENPRYDGFLQTTCILPESLGKFDFYVTNDGPDLSAIKAYCTETPKALRKKQNSQED